LFIYILLYALVAQFFAESTYTTPTDPDVKITAYLQLAIDLIIVGVGTYLCFYANGGNAGKHFAERYFSIGLVVGLRFLALMIPVFALFGAAWALLSPITGLAIDGPEMDYAIMVLTCIWMTLLFWRYIKHINDVAKATHTKAPIAP
jgi:hypothetical protein